MSKVDWSKAPEDAQFYSLKLYRKHVGGLEYSFRTGRWVQTFFDSMNLHKIQDDFEIRPEPEVKTYTGQMTADQLRNTKIRIESVEHGKAFREMVSKVTQHSTEGCAFLNRALFLVVDNDGFVAYEDSDLEYFNDYPYAEIKWQPAVSDEPTPEEDEAFAALEAKSGAKAEGWNGEGLPPAGIECEFNHPDFGWTGCATIGVFRGEMVCAPNGGGFYQGSASMYRPAKSEREKWLESAMECLTLDGRCTPEDFIGMAHDAMVRGDLPVPKVKK